MTDRLLPLYDQELAYLRRHAGAFADAYPKIAGRLRLSPDAVDDPHVARLIEGFALIAARIRQKLDDEFPELTDSLLGALYPHLLAPFPSCSIAQFAPVDGLDGSYRLARNTALEVEPVEGESCRYRTTQEVELWPITIREASITPRPLVAPAGPGTEGAVASLRLVLECLSPKQDFGTLGLNRLRLHLRGLPQHATALYELMCNELVTVAVADHAQDQRAVFLPQGCLRPVGFGDDEGLLPASPRSFLGYRLLMEYLAFPAKFMFVDLDGISAKTLRSGGSRLEVFFYFRRMPPGLERLVNAESFGLGCTPIVNLFTQRAEPLVLNHEQAEQPVVPDARRHRTREVFSVDRVTMNRAGSTPSPVLPFFASHHAPDPERQRLFWTSTRRRLSEQDESTDVLLTIVDTELSLAAPNDGILSVETTCLNRDLPKRVPYGGGRPGVSIVDGAAEVTSVRLVAPPTPTYRPVRASRAAWRLISQLSLNHLSISGGREGADALREIMRLHDFRDAPETHAVLGSVQAVRSQRSSARLPGQGGMCRGLDIEVELDQGRLEGGGAYVLASVLDRFLGLYASINSFSRLTVTLSGREGVYARFPARAGDRPLL